jgi:hypothetical protein
MAKQWACYWAIQWRADLWWGAQLQVKLKEEQVIEWPLKIGKINKNRPVGAMLGIT